MNPWDITSGDYTQLTKHFTGMGGDLYQGAANSGGRDLGVQIYGDAFKVGKTQHYLLHYQAGIYNGQGINTSDKDKEKDYIATVQLQPLKGLYVGVFGWSGSFFDGAQSNYFKRWAAGVSYEGLFSARAEYARNIYADGADTHGLGQKSDAWYIRMGIPTWRWLRVNLGYDAYRKDMSTWTSSTPSTPSVFRHAPTRTSSSNSSGTIATTMLPVSTRTITNFGHRHTSILIRF